MKNKNRNSSGKKALESTLYETKSGMYIILGARSRRYLK